MNEKKTWFQSFSIESAKYNRSIAEGLVDQLYERIHKDLKKCFQYKKKTKIFKFIQETRIQIKTALLFLVLTISSNDL